MFESFLAELRNRKVARVALIYCAAAFAVLEFSEIAFPRLGLPDSAVDIVLRLVLTGLPIAVLVAWFFDAARTSLDTKEYIAWVSLPTIVVATSLLVIGMVGGSYLGSSTDNGPEQGPVAGVHGVRIAVLPFENISGDEDQGYFSDGLSEGISTELSRFQDLYVIPSSWIGSYGKTTNLAQVGKELGTDYIISGGVRLQSSAVRINAQLIDVSSGRQLWADSYYPELTAANLFDVQTEVARRVVSTIADASGVLTREGQKRLRSQRTDNLEAYDCVLRGYAYLTNHDDESHRVARSCLKRAVELDPTYVDALAWLAYIYTEEYHHNRNLQPDALQRGLATAKHAIGLDASNPMARFAMAMTQFNLRDVPAFMAHAESAIALNRNYTTLHASLAIFMAYAGDIDRAVEITRQAQALNSVSPDWLNLIYASAYYQKGEYIQCLDALSKYTQGVDAQWHFHKAAALGQLGRPEEAAVALEQLFSSDTNFANDPIGALRRYLVSETTLEVYLEGLLKAGLTIPDDPAGQ